MELLENLIHQTAFFNGTLDWRNYVMILVAFLFLFLAQVAIILLLRSTLSSGQPWTAIPALLPPRPLVWFSWDLTLLTVEWLAITIKTA